mmetsp:Transcript_17546/g.21253  ORF Transcript_17546/g.21253 Transcript_17546/m.21253 type:complete len:135 (-) Transcript_17546:1361-1765(-)
MRSVSTLLHSVKSDEASSNPAPAVATSNITDSPLPKYGVIKTMKISYKQKANKTQNAVWKRCILRVAKNIIASVNEKRFCRIQTDASVLFRIIKPNSLKTMFKRSHIYLPCLRTNQTTTSANDDKIPKILLTVT